MDYAGNIIYASQASTTALDAVMYAAIITAVFAIYKGMTQ